MLVLSAACVTAVMLMGGYVLALIIDGVRAIAYNG